MANKKTITAAMKVVATCEFVDDEASEEWVQQVVEDSLKDAGIDAKVSLIDNDKRLDVICPQCGTGKYLCWDNDESFDSLGLEGDGIVSFYHCQNCKCDIEYYMPFNGGEDE